MEDKLQQFAEEIMGICARFSSIFGRGLPGMSGASIGSNNYNSGTDVTDQLRLATAEFVKLYQGTDRHGIKLQAEKIEGLLMMGQTLSVLSKQKVDYLIDNLHELAKGE
jgi:hypothetical protein